MLSKLKWLPAKDAPGGTRALLKYGSGSYELAYKTNHGEPFMETWRYLSGPSSGQQAAWPDFYVPLSDVELLIE